MRKLFSLIAAVLFAGSMMAEPYTLKFNGTNGDGDNNTAYTVESGVAGIFDAASKDYVASLTTVTNVYAGRIIAEDPSSLKFGTSSKKGTLAFKLATPTAVDSIVVNATQYGNDAAEVTVNGTKVAITAGNKKPQNCVAEPEGEVETITIEQSGSQRIYVRSVTIYPKSGAPIEPLTKPDKAPAVPAQAEEDVMAIYCNHYTTNNANFQISGWAGGYETLDLDGTTAAFWTGMTWECIIDPVNTDAAHDFSAYKNVHVDLWAPLPAKIKFTVEAVAGGNYKDGVKLALKQGWNSFDIALAEWPEGYDFKNVKCFVLEQYQTPEEASFEGNPFAIANVYFWSEPKVEPSTCAEILTKAKDDKVALKDVTVTYVNGKNVWVKDETAPLLLYLSANATWNAGDVLSGVEGVVDIYNNKVYEVKPNADQAAAVVATAGEAPAPEKLAAVAEADINKYAVVTVAFTEDAKFTAGTASNITIKVGEQNVVLRNNFKNGYEFGANKEYDITVLVSYYSSALQLYFVDAKQVGGEPTIEYYVCGDMTSWGVNAAYKLAAKDGEYVGEFTFEADAKLKVVSSTDGATIATWFPAGMGNDYTVAEAGDYTIRFKPEGNVEGWHEGFFLVEKKAALPDPTNCAEARDAALSVSENNELYNGGKEYTIQGYVTEIAYAWSSGSMSFWMADTEDGGKVIEAYKCAIEKEEDAVRVGDLVKVTGALTRYNNTPEFNAGCTVEIVEKAADPVNLGDKTIAEFLELKNAKDTCILTGTVKNIVMDTQDPTKPNIYGNFDLEDATASVYIYGLLTPEGEAKKFPEMGIVEGDIITIKAIYGEFNSAPQVKNAIFVRKKGQGIDNTGVETKVEKFFRNGQLIIRKNGVEYNAQGARVL